MARIRFTSEKISGAISGPLALRAQLAMNRNIASHCALGFMRGTSVVRHHTTLRYACRPFKVPDRVAVPSRIEIVWMLRLVQKDLTVAVNVSLKQKKDVRGRLDDPPGIGRDAWNAGWQAIRLGIVFRLSGLHNLFRFR